MVLLFNKTLTFFFKYEKNLVTFFYNIHNFLILYYLFFLKIIDNKLNIKNIKQIQFFFIKKNWKNKLFLNKYSNINCTSVSAKYVTPSQIYLYKTNSYMYNYNIQIQTASTNQLAIKKKSQFISILKFFRIFFFYNFKFFFLNKITSANILNFNHLLSNINSFFQIKKKNYNFFKIFK